MTQSTSNFFNHENFTETLANQLKGYRLPGLDVEAVVAGQRRNVEALAQAGSPSEVVAKQAELAKGAFEKALGDMRELAEMVTKAQQGAIDTMSGRISQSLDELKDMALKMKEASAAKTPPIAGAATARV